MTYGDEDLFKQYGYTDDSEQTTPVTKQPSSNTNTQTNVDDLFAQYGYDENKYSEPQTQDAQPQDTISYNPNNNAYSVQITQNTYKPKHPFLTKLQRPFLRKGTKERKDFLSQYNDTNVPSYDEIGEMYRSGQIDKNRMKELSERRKMLDHYSSEENFQKTKNRNVGKGAFELALAAIPLGVGGLVTKGVGALTRKLVTRQAIKKLGTLGTRAAANGLAVAGHAGAGAAEGAGFGALDYAFDKVIGAEPEDSLGERMKEYAGMGSIMGTGISGLGIAGKTIARSKAGKWAGNKVNEAINSNERLSHIVANAKNTLGTRIGGSNDNVTKYQRFEKLLQEPGLPEKEISANLLEYSNLSARDKIRVDKAVRKQLMELERPSTERPQFFGEEPTIQTNQPTLDDLINPSGRNSFVDPQPQMQPIEKLNRIEEALNNGTPITRKAIYEATPEEYNYLADQLKQGNNWDDAQAAEFLKENGVGLKEEPIVNQGFESTPYEFNPTDDINLFEQARDYNVPQNNIGYTPEVVQPRVSIPKVKPNTKKTLAEWKSKYSTKDTPQEVNRPVESQGGINTQEDIKTHQNEPSGHTLFVDRTYSKEELRSLPLEEFNNVRAQASRTLKMDATDYNNAYGKPYTKQALKRVKQTFDNAEAVYKEKYNPEVQRNTMENEGGNYDDNWKPTSITKSGWREVKNPDGTIRFRYRRKSKSPESPKLGSTNEIKPSKVSHSENYDTSTTEYKGIENTEGYKVTKLEPGKAEGSEYKPQRNTTGEEPNYYEGIEEGRYTEKELRDAYKEDIKENLELDNADIENRQKFFDKERMDEYGEEYNGKEETGTVYDEKYERGEYGEAENVAENEAEIFKNASEEFKQFWKEYKDLPKKEKTNYLRQYVKDMSFKNRKKFQDELVQQEDFLARKYSPKKAGDEYTDEYDYYNEGSDTQTLANATKSHNNNRAEQVYGDSLEVRENTNIKRISSEKQHSKSIDEANRFMAGKRWSNPSSNSAVTSMQGRFNINHGEAQKVYDRTLSAIKGSKLDIAGREHALKVLNKAAENFNNVHPNKAIDIKLDADIKPTSAETLLENANKSGDLSAGYNVLKYNKKLKSTDLGEEHYRQSQDKMLNETLPKLKEELSDLEHDLARATDPAQKELLQYKIDKKKIEMHEQAMERGQQGINYYRNFVKDKAEMSSYNRETGKYEKKGVSWDRHSEGLRQPEYEAVKNELESYSLKDYELENAKQRVADYEHKNRTIEFDENISDKDFVELATKNPSAIRKRMDSLPEDKQQKVVATVYNKALTTGKGLAIVRGKSTTIGQVAESGNKAFKEVLEQHPELKDAKVSTIPKGKSGIDIDTNEMFFSESSIKSNTLDHEILHIKDNQTPEGHALLIDLANKKQSVLDYVHNPDNKPTIDKAINLIGERSFSNNTKLYSFLRKNGFNSDEMGIIKGYKKLDSEVKNHYMEQRAQRAERGEDVSNIDKELAEMEKTSQIGHRQLQRTIESTKSKNGIFGLRDGRNGQNSGSIKNRRRLVAQEDSFINDLKSFRETNLKATKYQKYDKSTGLSPKEWLNEVKETKKNYGLTDSKARALVKRAANEIKTTSDETEKLLIKRGIITEEQAANRKKMVGSSTYIADRPEYTADGKIDLTRTYEDLKEGVTGKREHRTVKNIHLENAYRNTQSYNAQAKYMNSVMDYVEKEFAKPIENGRVLSGYKAVNSKLLSNAVFGRYSKEWYETIYDGPEAIRKAFKDEKVAKAWEDLHKRTNTPDIQIPEEVYNSLFSGKGESAADYISRYGSKHPLKSFGKLTSAVHDAMMEKFKQRVLTSASFVMNNRIGNQIMIAAHSDNPGEYIKSLYDAFKIKNSDLPAGVLESNINNEIKSFNIRKKYTGYAPLDNAFNLFGGQLLDTSTLKGMSKVSATTLNWFVGKPARAFAKWSDKVMRFNQKFEDFERRQVFAKHINKERRELVKRTGQKMITQQEFVDQINKNSPLRETIIEDIQNTLGDYNNFSKFEKDYLKRVVPFYSWYRTISRHTYQLAKKNPTRAALIMYELDDIKNNSQEDLKEYQRGSIKTGVKNELTGDNLVINKMHAMPYMTFREDLGVNPFIQVPAEAIRGKKFFQNQEISNKRYARFYEGKDEKYYDTKTGKTLDKLPVSTRVGYVGKQLLWNNAFPYFDNPMLDVNKTSGLFFNKFSKDASKKDKGQWHMYDKSYDATVFGGFNIGDKVGTAKYKGKYDQDKEKEVIRSGKSRYRNRTALLNRGLGLSIQNENPSDYFSEKEEKESLSHKLSVARRVKAWRAKHKKK